jgi:AcrR family transcriptional regulator
VERILVAAAHVFDERGYGATTTNDIADEAGVAIGSLYQYFPNKDAILIELTRQHIDSTLEGLTQLLGVMGPQDNLAVVVRTVVDYLVAQHELDTLHLLVAHSAPRTPQVALELDRAKERLVELAAALMVERFPDEGERLLTARMVVAIVDAGVHDVILRQPQGEARHAAVEMTVSTVSGLIADRPSTATVER